MELLPNILQGAHLAQRSVDVVIVGGGVAGCAAAYELAAAGLKPLVVERDAIASHASGFAFGELLPWWGRGIPGPLFPFARECMKLHQKLNPTLREETGIDTEFKMSSAVLVAFDQADTDLLLSRRQWLVSQGVLAQWLDVAGLRQVEPRISAEAAGGLYLEGVGILDSYKLVLALAQGAQQHGAAIRQGNVQGIKRQGDRAVAVILDGEIIPCQHLVLAAGPWSGLAGEWLGMPVPVKPLKGQILRLELPGAPLTTYVGWESCYATTKGDGLLWAGTTEEDVGFDEQPTLEARNYILQGLIRALPAAQEAQLVRQTACLRPLSADGLPILGKVPNWVNVYLTTGAGRNGLLLGPGMGRCLAQLIMTGECSCSFQIAPFSLERFNRSDSAEKLISC
jgi:glycine oxidase